MWLFIQILESQLKIKQQQVEELQAQQGLLKDVDPDKEEEILQKKVRVEERYVIIPIHSTKVVWFEACTLEGCVRADLLISVYQRLCLAACSELQRLKSNELYCIVVYSTVWFRNI